MAIRSGDPFDVLRHYILVEFPEGADLEPLSVALEALSERLDALDNITRWLAAGAKPPYDFVDPIKDAVEKERWACAEVAAEHGADDIAKEICART